MKGYGNWSFRYFEGTSIVMFGKDPPLAVVEFFLKHYRKSRTRLSKTVLFSIGYVFIKAGVHANTSAI